MTTQNFNIIVEDQLDRIESLLVKKGAEYNLDENDRFSDFKQAAAFTGQTPEQVLYGYMLKHLMSVTAMVQSEKTFTKELWNEKITDICNYLILLQGLLRDPSQGRTPKEASQAYPFLPRPPFRRDSKWQSACRHPRRLEEDAKS